MRNSWSKLWKFCLTKDNRLPFFLYFSSKGIQNWWCFDFPAQVVKVFGWRQAGTNCWKLLKSGNTAFCCRKAFFASRNSIYRIFIVNVAKILTYAFWGKNSGSSQLPRIPRNLCQPGWRSSNSRNIFWNHNMFPTSISQFLFKCHHENRMKEFTMRIFNRNKTIKDRGISPWHNWP